MDSKIIEVSVTGLGKVQERPLMVRFAVPKKSDVKDVRGHFWIALEGINPLQMVFYIKGQDGDRFVGDGEMRAITSKDGSQPIQLSAMIVG